MASPALSRSGGGVVLSRFRRLPGCARDAEGDDFMRRAVAR